MARRDTDPKTFGGFTSVKNIWTEDQKFNDCVRLYLGSSCDASIFWTGANNRLVLSGTAAPPGELRACALSIKVLNTDACNSSVNIGLTLGHNSTAAPAANMGVGIRGLAESSTTNCRQQGQISWTWTCVTDATRTSDLTFNVTRCGTGTDVFFIDGSANSASMFAQRYFTLGSFTDANRGAAGTAGRVIWNTTDTAINVDDGTNWRLITGCIT